MKLWKISQEINRNYDTYDSAVVAAESEELATLIHPDGCSWDPETNGWYRTLSDGSKAKDWNTWANPQDVKVELIGDAVNGTEAGVIVASFNSG